MYKSISGMSLRRTTIALLASTAAISLCGCGLGSPAVATTNSGISGTLYGGRQPIMGAVVTIWAAGTGGYGSAATSLASTTSAGPNGSFSIPAGAYACPTINTPLYITAVGGNPGNANGRANPDIVLAAPLGLCSTAEQNAFVNIDEVTTVATAFALSGFINPANFGTSASVGIADGVGTTYSATPTFAANNNNLAGVTNAMNLVSTLVNVPAGTAPGTVANATVDVAKVNTMADILVYCVNSDPTGGSTACSTLFADVSPTNSASTPTATNTFEAAYYLARNPTSMAGTTSNLAAVYGLAVPTSPYQPVLSVQPTDWTIGVNYAAAGMTAGQRLAIDSMGNAWVSSANSTAGGQITEFGPTGNVLTSFTGTLGGVALTSPMGIAVDRASILNGSGGNNVTVADSGTNSIFVINEGTNNSSPVFSQIVAGSATAGEEPYAIGFGTDLGMYITSTTTNAVTATQTPVLFKSSYSTTTMQYAAIGADHAAIAGPFGLVNSKNNTVFVVGQYQLLTSSTSNSGAIRNFNTPSLTGSVNQYANTAKANFPVSAVFDSSGNFLFSNAAYAMSGGTVYGSSTTQGPTNSFLSITGVTYNTGTTADALSSTTFPTAGGAGGLNNARYLAIDGNNSVWVANAGGVTSGTTTTYGVSQFADTGLATPTALSPAMTGYVHAMAAPNDIATDGSGNVWVVNGGPVNYVTEIVGAATPTVTPIAYNIKYNTWGQRP